MMLLVIMVFNAMTKYRHCNIPFSNKDKAVIKNLYQFKKYGLHKIPIKFSKTNSKKKRLADWALY